MIHEPRLFDQRWRRLKKIRRNRLSSRRHAAISTGITEAEAAAQLAAAVHAASSRCGSSSGSSSNSDGNAATRYCSVFTIESESVFSHSIQSNRTTGRNNCRPSSTNCQNGRAPHTVVVRRRGSNAIHSDIASNDLAARRLLPQPLSAGRRISTGRCQSVKKRLFLLLSPSDLSSTS